MTSRSRSSAPLTLTLGFSPCPNDCFIFDALLNNKIDTEGLSFKPIIEDVEALNKKAFRSKLDITKLSFFTYAQVRKKYALLDSGSALGFGVGPLLIAKDPKLNTNDPKLRIAIPGKNTTANLLFSLVYPHLKNKKEFLFSNIEEAVLRGKVDAGVIIHESRFTYQKKGLNKIIDLGNWWEQKYTCPIPLGGIAIRKNISSATAEKMERVIRRSIRYAFSNPLSSKLFVKKHAQEMDNKVIQQHIKLYVNRFSISLGKKGAEAVKTFLKEAERSRR